MHFIKRVLLFICISTFLLTGCSSIPANADTAFQNFTLSLFQSEVSSSTINLHYSLQNPEKYGITSAPVTLGTFDHSFLATSAYLENLRSALESFSYENLSPKNQLTYDVLTYYIDSAARSNEYYLYQEPLSPLTGIHAQLPILLAEYPFYSTKDVETYLDLLKSIPIYFESLVNFQRAKSAKGLFMSDSVADEVIAQCEAFVAMGNDNYLISTFEERVQGLNLSDHVSKNKEIVTSIVLPAYEYLAKELSALKGSGSNAKGLCFFDEGAAYYEHLAATSTGSYRNIKELKQLIITQIREDMLDMQTVLDENPSLLSETVSYTYTPEEMIGILQQKIAKTFPSAAPVNVEIKHVPHTLSEYLSPAFYLIPAIDNYAENTIYINDAYDMDELTLFTTLAHEGYPGHLYQTTYYAATNPDPIRTYLNFKGYVEGWATYAEMCSYYISPLEKPLATLMQKNSSVILGLYAAADIGIHYDGWDEQETIDFFSSYGIDDEETIKEIYKMILGNPTNYLSYYVGYVEILELKKDFEGSQMEFHKALLEIGPAPFGIIKEYL